MMARILNLGPVASFVGLPQVLLFHLDLRPHQPPQHCIPAQESREPCRPQAPGLADLLNQPHPLIRVYFCGAVDRLPKQPPLFLDIRRADREPRGTQFSRQGTLKNEFLKDSPPSRLSKPRRHRGPLDAFVGDNGGRLVRGGLAMAQQRKRETRGGNGQQEAGCSSVFSLVKSMRCGSWTTVVPFPWQQTLVLTPSKRRTSGLLVFVKWPQSPIQPKPRCSPWRILCSRPRTTAGGMKCSIPREPRADGDGDPVMSRQGK